MAFYTQRPTLSSLTLSPASVVGGSPSTATVTLSAAAPAGGFAVSLRSSATSAAIVPASVTVPAGAKTATVTVTTKAVTAQKSATITASAGWISKAATLTVKAATVAPTLNGLSLTPASVQGGSSSTGTVTLSASSPSVTAIALQSSSLNATVPGSVTVPAGSKSATFIVATLSVTGAASATITATLGTVSKTATLALTAPVANRPPTANAGGPYTGVTGQPVTLSGSGSDPDGDELEYGWAFGDGSYAVGASTTHVYGTAGSYNATLTVTDSAGLKASAVATATVADVVTPPPPPPPPTGTKALLKSSDLAYVGAFELPADVGGLDQTFAYGLALRYVNGVPRLIACAGTGGQAVFECSIPTPGTGANRPVASLLKNWGNVFGSKRHTAVSDGNTMISGLFWDEATKFLFWSYFNSYNATDGNDPAFGVSRFDDAAGVATALHYYRMQGGGCKAHNGGLTAIPKWFADAYCAGKRLGVGFGGYQSIITCGPCSMGPALSAIAPPTGTEADGASLANTVLLGYPYSEPAYGPPLHCQRDAAGYSEDFDDWKPRTVGGKTVGYWTWADWASQFGVWIDTPTKSGFLAAPILGTGRCFYQTSGTNTIAGGGAQHFWFLFDPADLAAVASGAKKSWDVVPAEQKAVTYPGVSGQGAWQDLPDHMVTGITFDAATGRLYIAIGFAGSGGAYGSTFVQVYQVQ